jgi:hypothetical protein
MPRPSRNSCTHYADRGSRGLSQEGKANSIPRKLLQVEIIDLERATLDFEHAEKRKDQRRLAAATATTHPNPLTWLNGQIKFS